MSREANITPRLLSFKYLLFVWLVKSVSPSLTFFIQSVAFWCPYKYISQVFPVHTLLPYLLVYQWLYIVLKNLKVAQTGKKTFVNSMGRVRPHIHQPMYFDKLLRQLYRACSGVHACSSVLPQWGETTYPCIHEIHERTNQTTIQSILCCLKLNWKEK